MKRALVTVAAMTLLRAPGAGATESEPDGFWSRWRGPRMDGIARTGNPPLEWSEERNVRWKIEVPGHGSSTPVIWGEHLYALTAVPTDGSKPPLPGEGGGDGGRSRRGGPGPVAVEQEFKVLALKRSDGSLVWEKTAVKAVPHEGKQPNNSYASASAITDGEHILAYFGSWGDTGEIVWQGPGLTPNAIPSPIVHDGVVYVTSGFRGNAAFAVRLADARGDITETPAILWQHGRDTPYVPSPLLYGGIFYLIKSNNNLITALDAGTGVPLYGPIRLEGIAEIYASPVGVAGKVVVLGRDGNALVLENGPELKVVARNSLDDGFDASPVFAGDEMYLRGYRHLYRISEN